MNERITLLAIKASDPKTGWLDKQKFAESIVRECARVATHDRRIYDRPEYEKGRKFAGIDVLTHFGVEE